jgi:hypothetical protein
VEEKFSSSKYASITQKRKSFFLPPKATSLLFITKHSRGSRWRLVEVIRRV